MNKFLLIIVTFFTVNFTFAQSDDNGNPIFNSISTQESSYDDFVLISNYYTLNNNIENSLSSVFISENPSLDQIEKAALTLSSEFFIITKDRKVAAMIMLENYPSCNFVVVEFKKNHISSFSCKLNGDITENRANEILQKNYDPEGSIKNNIFKFNNKEFKIITNKQIEEAVLELIKKQKLNKLAVSEVIIPSQKELKEYILKESKEGGDFDFFTEIKGKEYDGVQIKPGVFTTLRSIALYQWGRGCFDIGVNTVEDAYQIYSDHTEKTINERDKEYIRMGFYKEWEK